MSEQRTREPRMPASTTGTGATKATSARRTASRATARTRSVASRQGSELASTAKGEGQQVAGVAAERSREVVEASKRDAREVVDTAKEQASQVKQELAVQSRNLLDQSRTQLQVQAQTQTDRLADNLRRFGAEAEALADGRPEEAGATRDFVRQTAERLQGWADDLDERGVEGVIDDLADFARQRPGVFLLGAAAVGFGVGRLLRNGAAASGDGADETDAGVSAVGPPARTRRAPVSRVRAG